MIYELSRKGDTFFLKFDVVVYATKRFSDIAAFMDAAGAKYIPGTRGMYSNVGVVR